MYRMGGDAHIFNFHVEASKKNPPSIFSTKQTALLRKPSLQLLHRYPSTMVSILPAHGTAKVKSVLSGDTVVLRGQSSVAGKKAPEVTFTFERVTAPRMASKANNNVDDPAAFSSREWLRNLCVGKNVTFETR